MPDVTESSDCLALILVGDELLSARRTDAHLAFVARTANARGLDLRHVWMVGDTRADIAGVIADSLRRDALVICCGGIGATPDDQTRQAASDAFDRPLVAHPEGQALLEERYGDRLYPHRIQLIEFPDGAQLIPNPINAVPGFSVDRHHFVPGFPDMARPMIDWVLDRRFGPVDTSRARVTRRLGVRGSPESDLVPLLESVGAAHPQARLSCLPTMGDDYPVEIGATGRAEAADAAIAAFEQAARDQGIRILRLDD